MTVFYLFFTSIVLQRLCELAIAKRNEKWMKNAGGREFGQNHYYLIIFIHTLFLMSFLLEVTVADKVLSPAWPGIFLFFCLTQCVRLWAIKSLGRFWNTKIMVVPGASIIKNGPYRFLKHPNYFVVALEFILIPFLFQAYFTAIVFTLLNTVILTIRISAEEKALALYYRTE